MEKYISALKRTKLFAGIGEEDISALLNCLQAEVKSYNKGEYVLRQGENIDCVSVLLSGKLHIQRDDYWGNRSIINIIEAGEIFGESYNAKQSTPVINDVVAAEDSMVIFFELKKMLTSCSNTCKFHCMVVQNLFFVISEKNRKLVGKLVHMAQRTTREKLLSYLSDEAAKNNSSIFEIPFNRQQLADYLSVDRSSMSNELSKMRSEGLIEFEKNRFRLLGEGL